MKSVRNSSAMVETNWLIVGASAATTDQDRHRSTGKPAAGSMSSVVVWMPSGRLPRYRI